jgi:hypothetical protein
MSGCRFLILPLPHPRSDNIVNVVEDVLVGHISVNVRFILVDALSKTSPMTPSFSSESQT